MDRSADSVQDARSSAAFQPQRRRSLLLAVEDPELQVNDRRPFEEFFKMFEAYL